MTPDFKELSDKIATHSRILDDIRREVKKVIVGQDKMLDRLLAGLLARAYPA